MGSDHDVARQRLSAVDERALAVHLDVTREQAGPTWCADAEHAGTIVVRPACASRRMQQLEVDVIPAPAPARDTALGLAASSSEHARYANGTEYRSHAAAVIAVVVT